MVSMLERGLAQTQFSYDFYVFNEPGVKPVNALREEIKAEEASIEARKNSISDSIRNIFLNAQQTQKQFQDLTRKNQTDLKMHEIKKIQYDLGMITRMDLLDSEKTLIENEASLKALQHAFNELIFMLNYPHVASR